IPGLRALLGSADRSRTSVATLFSRPKPHWPEHQRLRRLDCEGQPVDQSTTTDKSPYPHLHDSRIFEGSHMLRSSSPAGLPQAVGAASTARRSKKRREPLRRSPQLESLEGRALMATINASATISAVPNGPDFSYTITLNNASTSGSAIGTFWYA